MPIVVRMVKRLFCIHRKEKVVDQRLRTYGSVPVSVESPDSLSGDLLRARDGGYGGETRGDSGHLG